MLARQAASPRRWTHMVTWVVGHTRLLAYRGYGYATESARTSRGLALLRSCSVVKENTAALGLTQNLICR